MSLTQTLLLVILQIGASKSEMYRKCIDPTDSDYSTIFKPLTIPPPMMLGSLIECAAYANYALNNLNPNIRASAFHYLGNNCTLGRTPPFDDWVNSKSTILDGSDGVHAVVNRKPVANATLLIYILLNEERQFEYSPSNADPTCYNSSISSLTFTYTMPSPVQTLEGQFSALPTGNTCLKYQLSQSTWSALTILLWYNNAKVPNNKDPLVLLTNSANSNIYNSLWASYSTGGDVSFTTFNSSGSARTLTSGTNAFNSSKWVYLGVAYNATAGIITLYVNGNGTLTNTNYYYTMQLVMDTLIIGKDVTGSFYLKNYLASVEVYNRVLNQAEVALAMAMSTTTRVKKPSIG